jgi:malate synthase
MKAYEAILSLEAIDFLEGLHEHFNQRRLDLLERRRERQKTLDEGELPDFLSSTRSIRQDSDWRIGKTPQDLECRWVEITGPTERKMVINALNSGADVFMADFEDANSPTWDNVLSGQINLQDVVAGTISFESPEGKKYTLNEKHAVLMVRPRGWHLNEKHLKFGVEEMSASLFDFGLFFFHNAKKLIAKGSGPYFYLPKMENHLEARLWNDVFVYAQQRLNIPQGTIKATVLIETILAAFEMEEILYELKAHSAGLNAGRWDYMFSIIKKFQKSESLHLPDRDSINMTAPFMRAYTELLVHTCHKRGAHAMGGMAAFIPNRKEPEVTERALKKVREDKDREVRDGFDGTWVAHPDLVSVAREIFEQYLKGKPNQKDRLRDVTITAADLMNFTIAGGEITEVGLRHNLSIAMQYMCNWLSGTGAVALFNLMEDAATAEISRAQVWQWMRSHAKQNNGVEINSMWVERLMDEEFKKIQDRYGAAFTPKTYADMKQLMEILIFNDTFVDFLTIPAYEKL